MTTRPCVQGDDSSKRCRRLVPALVNPWAEAVLHVLAYARATARLASSLYNPSWVTYAEEALGTASQRLLEEDAVVLGAALSNDDSLARAQLLAWLFSSMARAAAVRERSLDELTPADVDSPQLLDSLRGSDSASAAIEILRAAVELEMDLLASVPVLPFDGLSLALALDRVTPIAPVLAECTIQLARPLGIRGRLHGRAIWVGVPHPAFGVSIEHVSLQVAHEATVREVLDDGVSGYVAVEREAVARLALRAREHGLGELHQQWLQHFRVP